jgi:hypothetical protein
MHLPSTQVPSGSSGGRRTRRCTEAREHLRRTQRLTGDSGAGVLWTLPFRASPVNGKTDYLRLSQYPGSRAACATAVTSMLSGNSRKKMTYGNR